MITFGDGTTADRGYGTYEPQPTRERPGFREVVGAAFRLENDVANLLDAAERTIPKPDAAFDFSTRATSSEVFLNRPELFIGVRSDAEWDQREQRILRELKDQQTIGAAGAGGIAAAMAAGIASPTILIPGVNAVRAASVGKAAIQAGKYTAAITAGTEGVLHATQLTRDAKDTAIAIGGSAVLGGLLGGAIRYIDPNVRARLELGMAGQSDLEAIRPLNDIPSSAGPRGLSAQATPEDQLLAQTFNDPEGIAPGVFGDIAKKAGVGNVSNFSWLGPISRGLASPIKTVRAVTAQFGNAGINTQAGLRGEAAATDGVLEQLVKQHYAGFAEVNRAQKLLYRDYITEKKGDGIGARLRGMFPGGGFKEYSEEVGQGMFLLSRGQRHTNPAVAKAADEYMDKVFRKEIQSAKEAGLPPFNNLSSEYAEQIVLQRLRPLNIAEDYNAAQAIVKQNALEQLQDARLKGEEYEMDMIGRSIAEGADAAQALAGAQRGAGYGVNKASVAFADDIELDRIADIIADRMLERHLSSLQRHGSLDILKEIGEATAKYVYIDPTRTWDNGRTWAEFIENDAEKLARGFIRTIGPETEIYRKFQISLRGTDDFEIKESKDVPFVSDFLDEVKMLREGIEAKFDAGEIDAKQKRKELQDIFKAEQQFETDLKVLIGRLRHTQGMPNDPTHFGYRAGRAALQLNTMRLMGTTTLSSIPDLARTVMKYGFDATLRDGLAPMLKNMKTWKMSAREAQHSGEALDILLHSRLGAIAELFDEVEYGNTAERMMQYGTSMLGKVALFDYWNTGLKQFSGVIINAQIGRALEASAAANPSKKHLRLLGQFNISQADAVAMQKLITSSGGSKTPSGVWLPNTEDWTKIDPDEAMARAEVLQKQAKEKGAIDKFLRRAQNEITQERRRLQRVYRSALAQGISDTIVTPGLERPNWVDNSTAGRLISQFRSFTLSSTFKTMLAGSQEARAGNMAPIASGMAFSLALGVVSYYLWATSIGGNVQQKMLNELDAASNGDSDAVARLADEAVTRSGLTGLFAELQKFAERTPGLAPYATFAGEPPQRSPFLNPVQEMFGPTMGMLGNISRIAVTADDPTKETFTKAQQLMPYQNIFYTRRVFDSIVGQAEQAAGVSP